MLKIVYFIFLFITCIIYTSCDSSSDASKFIGQWKLYKYEILNKGIWQTDSTRIGHKGFIMYDGQGHMSVQIVPLAYIGYKLSKKMDSLSFKEMKELADHYYSNYVYFANYTVHEHIVEHHILFCTEPSYIGIAMKREFEFKGDTLILTPVTLDNYKFRLKWIKQQ